MAETTWMFVVIRNSFKTHSKLFVQVEQSSFNGIYLLSVSDGVVLVSAVSVDRKAHSVVRN